MERFQFLFILFSLVPTSPPYTEKDGGIRPIVGCTLRHLVAKVAGAKVMEEMGALLALNSLVMEPS